MQTVRGDGETHELCMEVLVLRIGILYLEIHMYSITHSQTH